MDRRSQAIQNALPILARAIGRKLDVNVAIGGDAAWTDGTRIQLPTLPFSEPEVETLAFGYLEHEAAHVRYTEEVEPSSPLHHSLCNVLEDVRIEGRLGEEYPGFAATLRDLVALLVRDGEFTPPSKDAELAEKLGKYLLFRLRSQVLNQAAVAEYAEIAERVFRDSVSQGLATRIGSVIGRANAMTSTQDASDLAAEIVELIEDERDQLPEGNGDQAGNSPDSGKGGSPDDGASPSPADVAMRHALDALLDSDDPTTHTDIGGQVGAKLEGAAADAVGNAGGLGAGIGNASSPLKGVGDAAEIMASVNSATSALRTRLRGFVEATKRNQRAHRRQGKHFDRRRAVRAMMGDPKVYRTTTRGVSINTAACILLDRSISMGHRMEVARNAALASAAALEENGVNVGAAAFPGYRASVDPLTLFSEKVPQTAPRFAGVDPDGGTPLLDALFWSVDALLQQPESRRLLLVVTDGEPTQVDACKEAIRRCWLGGIEAMGIGIQVPDISALFPVSRCITDISELPSSMFELLQAALTYRQVA